MQAAVRASVALLVVVGVVLSSTQEPSTGGDPPNTCCFDYSPRRIRKELVTGFFMTEERCLRPAVVLVLNNDRRVCVDPTLSWVKKIITAA